MELNEKLFKLKDEFWKEYKNSEGKLDFKLYEYDDLFKDLLINFFNNYADFKITSKIDKYNKETGLEVNPYEMLEDLLRLRCKTNQLPSDLIAEALYYQRHNMSLLSQTLILIREYATSKGLSEDYFDEEVGAIVDISNKYSDYPIELIAEFLDYLKN